MYADPFEFFVLVIILIIIIFIILLVIRNFVCWYYKINLNIQLLDSINKKLEFLSKHNFPNEYIEFEKTLIPEDPIIQDSQEEKDIKEKHECSKCEKIIQGKEYYCSKCNKYFCYDCIIYGLKCPECKSKLVNYNR